MRGRYGGARVGASAALLVLGLLLGACSGHDERPEAAPSDPARVAVGDLAASLAQFRFDEGTLNLRAAVTNHSHVAIRVSSATIVWDGLAFPMVPVPDPDALPGQSAAFTIAYGAPHCDTPPRAAPTLVAVVDGRSTTIPLHVDQPGLLDRLRAKACAEARLDRAARVRLTLATRTVRVAGEEYLPGRVVVAPRPGATERVRVVDLGGSVLIDLLPRRRGALPADGTLDVLLGSAHRCDAHARGQSSQTFLLSAYLRVGSHPVQREIFVPAVADQERLLALIDRDCRG